jgi:hypothetical protein
VNQQQREEYIVLNGIVDKVRAVRGGATDDVRFVEATVHVKMGEDYVATYGGSVTTDLSIPLPVTTEINPGDVAVVTISTTNPFGRRFVGALDMGNDDDDDDIIDLEDEDDD